MNGKNEISVLKMADVIPTPDNPRHVTKDDSKVKELAESIKNSGLLYPVICRPHPKHKGKYDLRAGFRRFLAHQVLGNDMILAIVRDMDDKTALEVTILENLQRENLTPLEEARGVDALLKSGRAAADVAVEIGKGLMWVYRRAKLVDLIPEIVKTYEDPKSDWHRATAGHLEIIARLPAERQKQLFKKDEWQLEQWMSGSAGEFAKDLAEDEMLIRSAPWDSDDMTLSEDKPEFKIACSACPARSDRIPELFMDDTSPAAIKKNARCLNPDCWRNKERTFLTRREAELRQKHGDNLVIVGGYDYSRKDAPVRRTHDEWSVEQCKEKAPGARPALFLGKGAPKEGWVKVKPSSKGETASNQPPLAMRRKAWVVKYVEKALMAKDAECPLQTVKAVAAFVAAFGVESSERYAGSSSRPWSQAGTLSKATDDVVRKMLWEKVRPVLKARLRYFTVGDCKTQYEDALEQGALLGLGNEARLMNLAEAALPGKQTPAKKTKPDQAVTKPAPGSGKDEPCAKCGHPKSDHVGGAEDCAHEITVNGELDTCACEQFIGKVKSEKAKA